MTSPVCIRLGSTTEQKTHENEFGGNYSSGALACSPSLARGGAISE